VLLSLDSDGPLQQQAYRALRAAIMRGAWQGGARIPSSRLLASELRLSRNTLLAALEQLRSEGYLTARPRSGLYVVHELPEALLRAQTGPRPAASSAAIDGRLRLSKVGRGLVPHAAASWELPRVAGVIDFRYGEPAYRDLPIEHWARLLSRTVRKAQLRELSYRAPGGHPELRAALASYLARARGVRCMPEQVIVTSGSQQAIDLCARVLLDPQDRVALEDPHYPGFRLAFALTRARIVGIPVDDQGLIVERLRRQRGVRLVCVTPSHQFPTGVVLTAARRVALIDWARRHDAFVIEDDYDSEFRYAGLPLESLQGRDAHGRVLYVGTFSKLLFPALRLGYLVVPEALVPAFLVAKAAADTGTPGLEQAALAQFIQTGDLERHLRKTRLRSAARRSTLMAALGRCLGERAHVPGAAAGLHVWLNLPHLPPSAADALRQAGLQHGVSVHPSRNCHLKPPSCAAFVLGYANLSPAQIELGVERLARALGDLSAPR